MVIKNLIHGDIKHSCIINFLIPQSLIFFYIKIEIYPYIVLVTKYNLTPKFSFSNDNVLLYTCSYPTCFGQYNGGTGLRILCSVCSSVIGHGSWMNACLTSWSLSDAFVIWLPAKSNLISLFFKWLSLTYWRWSCYFERCSPFDRTFVLLFVFFC